MSGINAGMMSSETDDWATPLEFFLGLDYEFHFGLDVCASEGNAKVSRYFDREMDGLAQQWAPDVCWMNPPYGKTIGRWVEKAWLESLIGATVVGLLPARTDTIWWHNFVLKASEVRFIRGRLRFSGKGTAPFPSAVVIWTPGATQTVARGQEAAA
jgi:phage N-6-adenine-methyltransferase